MTYTANKNNNQWTDKHDAFCLENKLTPCAKTLWAWLLRQKDDEPDLKEFNKWAEKHRGKGYCRLTIKTAFNQLVECRVIQLVKKFTWHLVRIATRTLDELFPKKNLRNRNQIYSEQTSNPTESNDGVINSDNSPLPLEDRVEILQACAEKGIFFNPEQDSDLYDYSKEDIHCALEYYVSLSRRSRNQIVNPQGWLLSCLQWRYWEELRLDGFTQLLTNLKQNIPTTTTG